ncbi:MAG TPA: hypothetical protein VF669_11225 [Tepidisphaeraceae bacterium]|jgi:tetratricopeptide (TPR) repeat protein
METPEVGFLDVGVLLDASEPRPARGVFGFGVAIFAVIVLLSAALSAQSKAWSAVIELVSPLAMMAVIGVMMLYTSRTVQRRREEMKQLEAIEELMQLRRWREAAMMLQGILSQPTRTPQARAQALIYLSSVLSRYHRFSDAIAVQDHLLQTIRFDDGTDYAIRLGRAMAMLREDHLVDADRAMNELRRLTEDRDRAGLALVELYRDVKTGHPEEAVAVFERSLEALRDQLGHRVGDAYVLVAKAYDMLKLEVEARQMYEKATLLEPVVELERRYPEVATLRTRYAVAPMPEGMAA